MDLSFKLISFREYKNWEPTYVAQELGLSYKSYKDLEKGQVKLNGIMAQKLSDLYQVPIEFFLKDDTPHNLQAEVMYANCTFTNGTGSTGGYINHQYNDKGTDEIIFKKNEEIKKLEYQISALQKQNDKLIEMLGEGVKQMV